MNMPAGPLTGSKIVLTRPEGRGMGLSKLLEEAGAEVVPIPLLAIESSQEAVAGFERLNGSEHWDWIIFISTNAVRAALEASGWQAQRSPETRIAAVGDATRDALEAQGVRVDLVPSQFSSEGLLEDARLADVQGQRILIVRGEGGREFLRETLVSRGAEVFVAELYRRAPVPLEMVENQWQMAGGFSADIILITSGEALAHLTTLWQGPNFAGTPRPLLLVPGPRLVRLAHEAGWPSVLEAESPTDEALAQAIRQWAYARKTGQTPFNLRLAPAPTAGMDATPPVLEASEPEYADIPPTLEPDEIGPEPDPIEETPVSEPEIETVVDAEPTEAAAKKGKKDKKAEREPKTRRSGGFPWIGYLMLIGTLVLAGGGWFVLQELRSRQEGLGGQISDKTQQVQEVTHQLTAVQTEVASLHAQISTLQSQAATDDAKIERVLSEHSEQIDLKLGATRNDLAGAIQQIQSQLNKTRGDLLVTDAEYLLSVANQKLNLIGDVKSVLAAMEAADQRLRESGDPAVFKVREVLAGEMASLKKVVGLDVVGLSANLIALQKKVPQLPTHLPHAGTLKQHEVQKAEEKAHPGPQDPDADAVDHALQGIKELVTVRRVDRGVEAMLAPEQVHTLQQILVLKLETTRAALLRNDQTLYRESLEDATRWIEEHFDTNVDITRDMLKEIAKLSDYSLSVAYPDISKSLVMLQNIEKLRLEAEERILNKRGNAAPSPETAKEPVPQVTETPAPAKGLKGAKGKTEPLKSPEVPAAPAAQESKPKEPAKPEGSTAPSPEPAPAPPAPESQAPVAPQEASGERL
jgi:uroporphyrinogen III methyltransferase / synthase